MSAYINDLLVIVGFAAAVVGMYFLAPWLILVWIGLLLVGVGLYRARIGA